MGLEVNASRRVGEEAAIYEERRRCVRAPRRSRLPRLVCAHLAALALAGMSCAEERGGASSVGGGAGGDSLEPLRGFYTVETILRERLVAPGASFSLRSYLEPSDGWPLRLVPLLSASPGQGLGNAGLEPAPNPLTVMLWHAALSGVAADVAALCAPRSGSSAAPAFPATARFSTLVASLCAWPAPAARSRESLAALWLAVMKYDAPHEELAAFVDFFAGPTYANAAAPAALHAMFTAMFLNPSFLLSR